MGILDNVTKASDAGGDFIKALIFGDNGSGKSTLCGTAPAPILYAYTEKQGLISLKRMAPEADVIEIKSMADLRALLTALVNEKHNYSSVCLDSFTEMQQLLIDEVSAKKGKSPDEIARLSIEDRMFIHDKSKSMTRAFRNLPMHVILTCLSEKVVIRNDDDSAAKTMIKIMLSGQKLPGQIGQYFNIVGFAYKAQSKDGATAHKVLLDGRPDLSVKGMPGLRQREDPDISYWYERAILGKQSREPDAPAIAPVSRGVVAEEPKAEKEAKKK
jgi:hypothetical protein